MGLDMYLEGYIYFSDIPEDQLETQPIGHIYRLGYWRKHPDLHGFIVREFAKGEDNCQSIPLQVEDMRRIIQAVRSDSLPHTEGFFFGESANDDDDKVKANAIFRDAIRWCSQSNPDTWREVFYRASW